MNAAIFGTTRQPFAPAPRRYTGNMCGTRVANLPPIPGGAADPSLVVTWLVFYYSAADRQRIYANHRGKGLLDFLVSWPDFQNAGGSPVGFQAHCDEVRAAGLRPCAMLSAKPTSSTDVRTIDETLANILLVLPLLVGRVPRFCVGWELSLWLTPQDVQVLINALAPIWLQQPGTLGYVHLQEGYSSFQVTPGTFADFWNLQVGKLTGLLRQKILSQTPEEYRGESGGINDVLTRFAGNFNVVPDSGFGHPFDDIELEITATFQFDGSYTEAQGDALGQWAIDTPAQTGPAGAVTLMGSGNGQL